MLNHQSCGHALDKSATRATLEALFTTDLSRSLFNPCIRFFSSINESHKIIILLGKNLSRLLVFEMSGFFFVCLLLFFSLNLSWIEPKLCWLNLCDTWLKNILANRASPARVIRSLLTNNIVITSHFYIASAMLMEEAKLPYSPDYQNACYFLYSPYFTEFAPFASEQNVPSLALLPSASRSLAT